MGNSFMSAKQSKIVFFQIVCRDDIMPKNLEYGVVIRFICMV
jgi:hypothetical protein